MLKCKQLKIIYTLKSANLETELKLLKLKANKIFDISSYKCKNFKAYTCVLENKVLKDKQSFLMTKEWKGQIIIRTINLNSTLPNLMRL